MSAPRRIVIDCDPGIDDAAAILLALADPSIEIAAITCVDGNSAVDTTVANARRILDLANRPDIPVYRGADRPLLQSAPERGDYYGRDGLGDIGLPEPSRGPDGGRAAEVMIDTVMAQPPDSVTLVAIGPLTNVALAMRLEPRFAGRLAGIVVMGGDVAPGAAAEFNVGTDAAAAAIVFSSEARITLTPYTITKPLHASTQALESLAVSTSLPAKAVAAMQQTRDPAGSALHDAYAIATLLKPALFHFDTGTVSVDWRGDGVTTFTPGAGGSHRVVSGVDSIGFDRFLVASLIGLD